MQGLPLRISRSLVALMTFGTLVVLVPAQEVSESLREADSAYKAGQAALPVTGHEHIRPVSKASGAELSAMSTLLPPLRALLRSRQPNGSVIADPSLAIAW